MSKKMEKKVYRNQTAQVEVEEVKDGDVTFLLLIGLSCPLRFNVRESTFNSWLKEKGYKEVNASRI